MAPALIFFISMPFGMMLYRWTFHPPDRCQGRSCQSSERLIQDVFRIPDLFMDLYPFHTRTIYYL